MLIAKYGPECSLRVLPGRGLQQDFGLRGKNGNVLFVPAVPLSLHELYAQIATDSVCRAR